MFSSRGLTDAVTALTNKGLEMIPLPLSVTSHRSGNTSSLQQTWNTGTVTSEKLRPEIN